MVVDHLGARCALTMRGVDYTVNDAGEVRVLVNLKIHRDPHLAAETVAKTKVTEIMRTDRFAVYKGTR